MRERRSPRGLFPRAEDKARAEVLCWSVEGRDLKLQKIAHKNESKLKSQFNWLLCPAHTACILKGFFISVCFYNLSIHTNSGRCLSIFNPLHFFYAPSLFLLSLVHLVKHNIHGLSICCSTCELYQWRDLSRLQVSIWNLKCHVFTVYSLWSLLENLITDITHPGEHHGRLLSFQLLRSCSDKRTTGFYDSDTWI